MKGKYIVIEGGEGAGKDTHIDRLRAEFGDQNFVYTREPGGTELGKTLRNMLLHNSHGDIKLPTELLLFLADRAQHVEELIKPSLTAGKNVISNRSWISFLAYQIHGRAQFDWEPIVVEVLKKVFDGCPTDLVIILDVPYEVGHGRMVKMGKLFDTMESMPRESHERIRQAFLKLAKDLPQSRVIDASRSVDEVWRDVKTAVQSVI
ncbi:dTMP kinase [Candidatus Adlerbacteria bacterium RIFCSPHIGHO2_12_FULL_53_18]|uniref:Thymidylate kinase n=1 Tax=Candidatus Adlerbacteria bacterium RIFCSPHIGHO2_12_FULL_53_18 TaxID=1797242 RepID=A0A1F4XRT5_9BACT|nr:MAG: dTMP kinase [Candidatus Adlerbacteria bacterium RIFCSPHIGHO2_12_FULL_53_18]